MTIRWIKFSAVGLMGVAVQLAALQLFLKLGAHYLIATGCALEIALLHNYAWHREWTWASSERVPCPFLKKPRRLLRFHLANGLISLLSNLFWMRLLTGWLTLPPVPANLAAIALTSLINFVLADAWVFAASRHAV